MKSDVDAHKAAAEFERQERIAENTAQMEMDTTETNQHDFIYNMKYGDYLYRHMTKGGSDMSCIECESTCKEFGRCSDECYCLQAQQMCRHCFCCRATPFYQAPVEVNICTD